MIFDETFSIWQPRPLHAAALARRLWARKWRSLKGRKSLKELDDRLLRDIGIEDRAQIALLIRHGRRPE